MGKVTIQAVAEATGFSKTTVSFAFNDPARIGKETRAKILAAATELGYVPNPGARNLSRGSYGTIGLLLPQVIPKALENPYLSLIIQGIGQVCEQEGHTLTLIPPIKQSLLLGVQNAAVDGLITLGLEPEHEAVELIQRRSLPFVSIDGKAGNGFPVVGIRDRDLAREAMSLLIETGHRRIALVSLVDAREMSVGSHVRSERLAGYRGVFEEHFGHPGESRNSGNPWLIELSCQTSLQGGRELVDTLQTLDIFPDAAAVMSDIVAIGMMDRLAEIGITIPDRFSLVGFDDIPESTITRPRLTTISQPGQDKGRAAAETLMKIIRGEAVHPEQVLHGRLLLRETVRRVI
ncbi:transcriptional regulator, LacI family [Alkalispirochaeta americana]|uniref:Transcriptional regulator, LacI family n=1 Tax=Alkalispirochaeta americana TaxID=159291 RepID=A0A1N6SKP1_9SPIO|nr:LacI family DNA-binding transcriptional regulator [Alkalispirochaeta americana]SIQ41650.1 transcriptional regulator, LacI family [Alkalispirochaeta americana]